MNLRKILEKPQHVNEKNALFPVHAQLTPEINHVTLIVAGLSMKEVTDKLLVDGVKLFADAFKQLLDATGKSAGVHA